MAKITFNDWSVINLSNLSSELDNFNAHLAQVANGLNTIDGGTIYYDELTLTNNYLEGTVSNYTNSYEIVARGSGFYTYNPTVTSVLLTDYSNNQISILGSVNLNTGGKLTSLSVLDGSTNNLYQVLGSFILNPDLDFTGGSITSVKLQLNGYDVTIKGSLIMDANEEITGGVVTSYSLSDGMHSLAVSNISIDYSTLISATETNNIVDLYNSINLGGKDTLIGGMEDDSLDGGGGTDVLQGGLGNDTYTVDLMQTGTTPANYKLALQDTITEAANAGIDTLELRGDSFTNSIATTLTLAGTLEIVDATNTGYTKLNLTGNVLNNTIKGNGADNILNGAAGVDEIYGYDGNDTLDGGTGIDDLYGGTGNDTYILDSAADLIYENANEGNDTVKYNVANSTSESQTLIAGTGLFINIENITVLGTGLYNLTGDSNDNILIGNASINILTGNDGMDFLDGKVGADTMIGGMGIDTYVVDNKNDVVIEQIGEGDLDMINSSISFDLSTQGANVEYLQLVGTATNGTGNNLNNHIYGNSLANTIKGGAGIDYLNGGSGNDILDGGVDIDTMEGDKGNDTYLVDNVDDIVTEIYTIAQGGGIDIVKSSVSYALGANVDNLTLTDGTLTGGTAAIDGTGNELNNTITGNAGDNILDGGAGKDVLKGGSGNDTYKVDLVQIGTTEVTYRVALQDTITEATNAGTDTLMLRGSYNHQVATTLTLASTLENMDVSQTGATKLNLTGNILNNILTGNDAKNILNGGNGNDVLIGGLGADTLTGGVGTDTFVFNIIGDSNVGATHDVVNDFSSLQLDKIDLSAIDANTALDNRQSFNFIGNDIAFTNTAGELKYDSASYSIFGDVDGDGIADMQIGLSGVSSMAVSDFIL